MVSRQDLISDRSQPGLDSYRRLAGVFHDVLSEHNAEALLERIADTLSDLIPYDTLTIYRADAAQQELVAVLARDQWADEILGSSMSFGEGLAGWAAENSEPVLANQAHLDSRTQHVPGTPDDPEAMICVPLVSNTSIKGVLNIYRVGDDAVFTEEEFELAQSFGDAAALALENAESRAALERLAHTDSLTGLYNHRFFQERLRAELIRANRTGDCVALLMFDIDDFKKMNNIFDGAPSDGIAGEPNSEIARSRDEISQSISEGQRAVGSVHRRILADLREWDERELYKADGAKDMVGWVSGRFNLSHYESRLRITCAREIENLPVIAAALEKGILSLEKVVHLVRIATPETETSLVTWARRVQPQTIKKRAELQTRIDHNEVIDAHDSRRLQYWWSPSGATLQFQGVLPPAEGKLFANAIKTIADSLPNDPIDPLAEHRPSSKELFERRCADALVALSMATLHKDTDSERAEVVVYTNLDSVSAALEETNSEIEDGPVIHPSIARRLGCDCRLKFVLTDKEGNALGIGETSRNIPRWLKRELKKRDRHCTFPGCGAKTFLDGHHIVHWEDGGPTDLDNLALTCYFHHRLVHEHGWDVRLEGGEISWYRPSGERFEPGPDP